jgi:hypothetical protein
MIKKPTKTRDELSTDIVERLKGNPGCRFVTGVVIAPVLQHNASHPNWHAAFTMKGRNPIPRVAWQIGSEIAAQFDLA